MMNIIDESMDDEGEAAKELAGEILTILNDAQTMNGLTALTMSLTHVIASTAPSREEAMAAAHAIGATLIFLLKQADENEQCVWNEEPLQ